MFIPGFTKGLIRVATSEDLDKQSLVKATNVSVLDKLGVLQTRRGRELAISKHFPSLGEIHFQSLFTNESNVVRARTTLFDDVAPIKFNLANAKMDFAEHQGWLLCANGTDVLKYKANGMVLHWHTSYCFEDEEENLDTSWMYACLIPFYWGEADYRCTQPWEADSINGDSFREGAAFYTSSCDIGTTLISSEEDAFSSLLMHFDNNVTDSSGNHTPANSGVTFTPIAKFGSHSGYFDGASKVSVPDSSDWNMGTGVFTIDFWLRFDSVPSTDETRGVFRQWVDADNYASFSYNYNSFYSSHRFLCTIIESGVTTVSIFTVSQAWVPAAGTWYHVAFIRGWAGNADHWRITIDGVSHISLIDSSAWPDFGAPFEIGNSVGAYWLGMIDEFRVRKGKVTWSADFTPPTVAYGAEETATVAQLDVGRPVQLGVAAPATAPSAATGDPGVLTGNYKYKVGYVNTGGFLSNLSSESSVVAPSSDKVVVTIPLATDPQVVERHIYRTLAGGARFYYVGAATNNLDLTYDDNLADGSVGLPEENDHDVPPALSAIASHNALVYGASNADKSKIVYSNAFDEWEYFGIQSYEIFGTNSDNTQALETLGKYLAVIQKARIWNYNTREFPEEINESFSQRGAPNVNAEVKIGGGALIADARGIFVFDTVRPIPISHAVSNLFDADGADSDRINNSYTSLIAVGAVAKKYFVSYVKTEETTATRTLIYDEELKIFDNLMDVGFICFSPDRVKKVMYAACTDGYVYKMRKGDDDNGSAISWEAQSKDFSGRDIGAPLRMIELGFCVLDVDPNGNDYSVKVYLDDSLELTHTISGSARKVEAFRLPPGPAYRMALNFSGTGKQYLYGCFFDMHPREGVSEI